MKRSFALVLAAMFTLSLLAFARPVAAAISQTTITMRVSGCEGCTIIPATTPADSTEIYNGPRTKVKNGFASFVVPTAMTTGMYFAIEAAWKSEINAEPLIVFQYKGATAGGTVSKADAKSYKKASPCWSGTSASTAEIAVTVRRVWMPAFPPKDGARTQVPLAWVAPTQNALAPFWPVIKGVLAVQDSVECAV